MIQRCRDLGRAAKAVAPHPRDPVGIGGTSLYHAGDLLGQRAGARCVGPGIVEVIERRLAPAGDGFRGGEPGLMGGVIGGKEQIAFRQVLRMNKGIGICDTGRDAVIVTGDLPAIHRPRACIEPGLSRGGAGLIGESFRQMPHAQSIACRGRPKDPRLGLLPRVGVPVGTFIAARKHLYCLRKDTGERGEYVTEKTRDTQGNV